MGEPVWAGHEIACLEPCTGCLDIVRCQRDERISEVEPGRDAAHPGTSRRSGSAGVHLSGLLLADLKP